MSNGNLQPDPPKPGWKTTEFWMTLLAMVPGLLVAAGIIPKSDVPNLESQIGKVAAGAMAIAALWKYVHSRQMVKTAAMALLAVGMAATDANAQFLLPYRSNTERRLELLEQQMLQQQMAPKPNPYWIGPAPQQQIPLGPMPQQQIPLGPPPQQIIPIGPPPQQQIPLGPAPQQSLPLGPPPQPIQILPPTPVPPPAPPAVPAPIAPAPSPTPAPVRPQPIPMGPAPSQIGPVGPVGPVGPATQAPSGYQRYSSFQYALAKPVE